MSLARWFDGLVTAEVRERTLAFFEGERVSYGEVRDRAWALGSALQRRLSPGERVVTMLPNDPTLLVTQLAILHAGGVAVPVMAEGTPEEMRHFVDDSRASVVIATPERWAAIAPILHSVPRAVVLADEPVAPPGASGVPGRVGAAPGPVLHLLAELEADGAVVGLDPAPVAETDPMALMYTSGSTARPKGVVLDATGFVKDAELQPERFGLRDGETVLGSLQLFHIAGWHQALAIALGCRGGLMMQRRFSASRFWDDVDATGAAGGLLMPAMVAILLARPEQHDDAGHPLRMVMSHWVDERFERRFGAEIVPVWGQTELGGLAVSGRIGDRDRSPGRIGQRGLPGRAGDRPPGQPGDRDRPPGCVGLPLPRTEVAIRDPGGRDLPAGEVGEIHVRSPWVMRGYWDQPELTATVLRDGWVATGDLGYLDDRGRLFFSGRLKAMIKRAGENISALELEEAIAAHPDVEACACFSVPDPLRTEEAKAVVVARPGAELDLPALAAFAAERLAAFKVPRYWAVADELPRTRSSKVDYAALATRHDEEQGWDRTAEVAL